MKKVLLECAFYEDFEERLILGLVKDVEKVPALIKEDFETIFNETAKSEGFDQENVSYKKKIDITFDKELNIYIAKGEVIDIEMQKEWDNLPEEEKNDSIYAFMAPKFEVKVFYRLVEVKEL